ncbi:MAG: hypothetical protein ABI592_08375 [Acidobacteriota bacterium]
MARSAGQITITVLIVLFFISTHLFASKIGIALRGGVSRKRAGRAARREGRSTERRLVENEPIDPE